MQNTLTTREIAMASAARKPHDGPGAETRAFLAQRGIKIQTAHARNLAMQSRESLERGKAQAEARKRHLISAPDCTTKRTFLARENWVIGAVQAELDRRHMTQAAE